jgi:thioredoxin 1
MVASMVISVKNSEWQKEVIDSELPVLVDFGAEWCGPCHAIAPIIDEISDEMSGKLKVVKVDLDASPQLAATFGVQSIPTLLLLKNGDVLDRVVGAVSKAALKETLSEHL